MRNSQLGSMEVIVGADFSDGEIRRTPYIGNNPLEDRSFLLERVHTDKMQRQRKQSDSHRCFRLTRHFLQREEDKVIADRDIIEVLDPHATIPPHLDFTDIILKPSQRSDFPGEELFFPANHAHVS